MFGRYLGKFIFKLAVFFGVCGLYIFRRGLLDDVTQFQITGRLTPLHAMWLIFMADMVSQLFPKKNLTMALCKQFARTYSPPKEPYDKTKLNEYIMNTNASAMNVMRLWLSGNAVFAVLYVTGVIGSADLLMLTMLYYIGDLVCVLFFCPFQTFVMKTRCCVSCRIYSWGPFMMFTPMLFIRSFFSWSLVAVSLVLLIEWEIFCAKHPERFWEGSNESLRCENCTDVICRLKRPLNPGKTSESAKKAS